MTALEIACYVADVFILGTYAATKAGRPIRWFDWANALGCFPLLVLGWITGAYPLMVITGAFGVIGWVGVFRES